MECFRSDFLLHTYISGNNYSEITVLVGDFKIYWPLKDRLLTFSSCENSLIVQKTRQIYGDASHDQYGYVHINYRKECIFKLGSYIGFFAIESIRDPGVAIDSNLQCTLHCSSAANE